MTSPKNTIKLSKYFLSVNDDSNILTTILLYATEKKSTIHVFIDLYFGDGRETKCIVI